MNTTPSAGALLQRFGLLACTAAVGLLLLTGCSGDKYTYEEYYQIEDGMTLEQVEDILGGKGEAQPQTDFELEDGTVEYRWINPDGSFIRGNFDTDDLTIGGRGVYDFDDQMPE